MSKSVAKLLKFTVTGHQLYYSQEGYSNCHCSGYEDPESFPKPYHWWADPADKISTHFAGYQFADEGIPVLDLRDAVNTPEGRRWVFKGPMLDVDLEDGAIDTLPEVSPIMLPAVAAFGQTVALLETRAAQSRGVAGPLDSVSVSEFVKGWREHGAKVGRCYVENGTCRIEWE